MYFLFESLVSNLVESSQNVIVFWFSNLEIFVLDYCGFVNNVLFVFDAKIYICKYYNAYILQLISYNNYQYLNNMYFFLISWIQSFYIYEIVLIYILRRNLVIKIILLRHCKSQILYHIFHKNKIERTNYPHKYSAQTVHLHN